MQTDPNLGSDAIVDPSSVWSAANECHLYTKCVRHYSHLKSATVIARGEAKSRTIPPPHVSGMNHGSWQPFKSK